MALSVSMTGSGSIGNIAPGWSVGESVNSVAIGDAGAGTGSVSFNAQATDESLLVINNDTISTITNGDGYVGNFGTVHGIVQSVTQTGLNVSVTHGTIADKFNRDCSVEPVEWGGLRGWLYNMYRSIDIQQPQSYLPSIASAGASFPVNFSSMSSDYLYSFRSFFKDSFVSEAQTGGNSVILYSPSAPNLDWAVDAPGTTNSFLPFMSGTQTGTYGSITPTNSMVLQIKTSINENNYERVYLGNSLGAIRPSDLAYSNCFSIDIFSFALTARITELNTETYQEIDLSTFPNPRDILFTFQVVSSATGMTVKMYATDYNNNTVSTAPLFINNGIGTNWEILKDNIDGYIFAINAFTTSITGDLTPYINYFETEITAPWSDIDFSINDFYPRNESSFPATNGIAWELMQQLASAEHFEFAISGDTLIARSIKNVPMLGSTTFDITNVGSPPTINPQSTLSGKQINITYNNSEYINGVVYDAQADGNNVISVESGAITVTSVKHNVDPIALRQPTRYLATAGANGPIFTGPLPDGTYFVSDSTGLPISANQWEDFGGSVSVEIDPEDNSAIRITVVGPYSEIPSTTGPYLLEANDGEGSFAALKILGTGVTVFQNELALTTGIDPVKYTRATVNTISNPFIITEENAYDRGIWAAQKASGPVVSLSATIPTSSISGIGLTCGSLILYKNSTYRITSCSIGNLSTSINAERCVTVADVDAIWADISGDIPFTVNIGSPAVLTYSFPFPFANGEVVDIVTTGTLPNISGTINISSSGSGLAPSGGGGGGIPLSVNYYYATGHKVQVGDVVTFSGFTPSAFNGTRTVLGITENSFWTTGTIIEPNGSGGSGAVTGLFRPSPYVINATPTTFQIALQPGGSALTTTGTQSGVHAIGVGGVELYDAFWRNYECQDQIVFPYKVA